MKSVLYFCILCDAYHIMDGIFHKRLFVYYNITGSFLQIIMKPHFRNIRESLLGLEFWKPVW